MAKVKLLLEVEVDIPVTKKQANLRYRDALWPVEALALDVISDTGLMELIKDNNTLSVRDVLSYEGV